jgi:hypothetical protein
VGVLVVVTVELMGGVEKVGFTIVGTMEKLEWG